MDLVIEIPDYGQSGLKFNWEKGFEILVVENNGGFVIKANRSGLVSLARVFLSLSQKDIPDGYHVHLDDSNSLEDGSKNLVIELRE